MFEDRIAAINADTEAVPVLSGYEKRVYTVDEIQDILGVSKTSAYNLVKSGVISLRSAVSIGYRKRASMLGLMPWIIHPSKVKCAIEKIASFSNPPKVSII